MKNVIVLFLGVIGLQACSTKFTQEIAEIDRLLFSLDSAKVVMMSWDTGKVYRRIKTVENKVGYFIQHNDSASKETAILIDEYSNCQKYYRKMSMRFPAMFENIETIPMQLENLKTDLSKNLIEEEKAMQYLSTEKLAAEGLLESVRMIDNRFPSLDSTFEQTHEKILHLIQAIDSSDTSLSPS